MSKKEVDDRHVSLESGALVISKEGISLVSPSPSSFFTDDPDLASWVEDEINNHSIVSFDSDIGFEGIINLLSYLMFAVENEKWKEEFVDELERVYEEQNRQTPPEKKTPPHLRVIK